MEIQLPRLANKRINRGITEIERSFICKMCTFYLHWLMHMRITIVLVKLVFHSVRSFDMEQRRVIQVSVKWKNKNFLKRLKCWEVPTVKNVYLEQACLNFEWLKMLKEERKALKDDERKGRPSTSRTEQPTELVHRCLVQDRNLVSVRTLIEVTGINRDST
jgi:hypothetical protein